MPTCMNLKKLIIYLLVLVVSACDNPGLFPGQSNNYPNNSVCSEKPTAILPKKNVKKISLQKQEITESGQVSVTKNIGYKFEAEKGKKLNYKTDDDSWLSKFKY